MPHWLTHLGSLGLFAVAVVDSSVIPLPLPGSTDLLLLWLVSHHGDPWLLAASAIAGSILGGYTCWSTGRKGGEAALCAGAALEAGVPLDGGARHTFCLSAFAASAALSPVTVSAGRRGAGGFQEPISGSVQRSAQRTLRIDCVAWGRVRTPGGSPVVRHAREMVGTAALVIWGDGGDRHRLGNLEVAGRTEFRWRE